MSLFAALPTDTRNAVRDLILTNLREAGYTPADIKRCTHEYRDSEDKTVVRIQFKGTRKTGDLVIRIPGRAQLDPKIIVPVATAPKSKR